MAAAKRTDSLSGDSFFYLFLKLGVVLAEMLWYDSVVVSRDIPLLRLRTAHKY